MTIKHARLLDEDYTSLDQKINAKKFIRLADVEDRIERVAFDVVRFNDDNGFDKLWIVEEKDGDKVLVAMYDDDEIEPKTASANIWETVADKSGVNIFYKGEPIKRVAMASLGLEAAEAKSVCRYLPGKLASDKDMVGSLLDDLSESERNTLFTKYPELKG